MTRHTIDSRTSEGLKGINAGIRAHDVVDPAQICDKPDHAAPEGRTHVFHGDAAGWPTQSPSPADAGQAFADAASAAAAPASLPNTAPDISPVPPG